MVNGIPRVVISKNRVVRQFLCVVGEESFGPFSAYMAYTFICWVRLPNNEREIMGGWKFVN
jgi:hypothetical protein